MMKFDAYQGSTAESLKTVRGELAHHFRYGIEEQVRANKRYDEAVEVRCGGDRLYRLDGRVKDGVTLVTMSGDMCADVVPVFRKLFPDHGVSRVDACQDFIGATVFEDTHAFLVDAALAKGLRLDQHGDYHRKTGRTLYLGSTSSPVRVRWYEKGWEQVAKVEAGHYVLPDDFDITRCRLETQYRPASRDKALVATYTPDDVAAAAEWTRWAHSMMLGVDLARPQKVGVKRTSHEQKMHHLFEQYGRTLLQELQNCEGVLVDVARNLFDGIAEYQRQAIRTNSVARARDKQ